MTTTRERKLTTYLVLAGIVLLGFALRVWGNGFDLPHIAHPDEHHEVHRALRLGAGNFEFERIAKGGYFYLLFVEYGVFFVVGKLLGAFSSANDFTTQFFEDPTRWWLIGRTTTAVLGALNIGLIYWIGRRLGGTWCGLIAAALTAFSSLNVLHAHYVTVDVPMTTCVILAVHFSLEIAEHGRLKSYLLAAIFSALAVMTKFAAAPIVGVVLLAHILFARSAPEVPRSVRAKRLVAYFLVTGVVYVVGNPGVVVLGTDSLDMVLNHLRPATGEASSSMDGDLQVRQAGLPAGGTSESEPQGYWSYYGGVLVELLSWPLLIVVLASVCFALVRHSKEDLLLLSFPVLLFTAVSVSSSALHNPRYLLPALPFLFILTAELLVALAHRVRWSTAAKAAALTVVVAVLVAPQLTAVVRQNRAFLEPGNPLLCRQWVEANVPDRSTILIEGHAGAAWLRPVCPIQDSAENMEAFAAEIEGQSPMGALYARTKASVQEGKTFELVIVNPTSVFPAWEDVVSGAVEYVIVAPHSLAAESGRRGELANRSRLEFYDALTRDSGARLVREIPAIPAYDDHATRRGWEVEVYRIVRGPGS